MVTLMKKYPWNEIQKKNPIKTNEDFKAFIKELNKTSEVNKRQSNIVEKSSFVTLMKTKEDSTISKDLKVLKFQLKEMFKNGLNSDTAKQIMSDWTDAFATFKLVFTEEGEFDFQCESDKNYESNLIKLEFVMMYLPNSQYYKFFDKIRVCKNIKCNNAYYSSSKPDFCNQKCKTEHHRKIDISSSANKTRMGKRK